MIYQVKENIIIAKNKILKQYINEFKKKDNDNKANIVK